MTVVALPAECWYSGPLGGFIDTDGTRHAGGGLTGTRFSWLGLAVVALHRYSRYCDRWAMPQGHVLLNPPAGRGISRGAVPRAASGLAPADLEKTLLRVEVYAPGGDASTPIFDSNAEGATPPFSLNDLRSPLLPGRLCA